LVQLEQTRALDRRDRSRASFRIQRGQFAENAAFGKLANHLVLIVNVDLAVDDDVHRGPQVTFLKKRLADLQFDQFQVRRNLH